MGICIILCLLSLSRNAKPRATHTGAPLGALSAQIFTLCLGLSFSLSPPLSLSPSLSLSMCLYLCTLSLSLSLSRSLSIYIYLFISLQGLLEFLETHVPETMAEVAAEKAGGAAVA